MAPILRPKALRPGDTVAIAALSGSLDEEEVPLLERAIPVIEALGVHVRLAPLVDRARRHWWMAARPEEMAAEFNELLRDPEVRAIFTSTGGRATLAYLDLIDFDAVRADPKPLLGFSDISVLDLALHGQTGLVTIHSELTTWGFGMWEELPEAQRAGLVDAYRRILTSEAPLGALPATGEWETWRPGRAEGPLVGGLLNRLLKVQATPFAIPLQRFDGAILFWEEVRAPTPTIWYQVFDAHQPHDPSAEEAADPANLRADRQRHRRDELDAVDAADPFGVAGRVELNARDSIGRRLDDERSSDVQCHLRSRSRAAGCRSRRSP